MISRVLQELGYIMRCMCSRVEKDISDISSFTCDKQRLQRFPKMRLLTRFTWSMLLTLCWVSAHTVSNDSMRSLVELFNQYRSSSKTCLYNLVVSLLCLQHEHQFSFSAFFLSVDYNTHCFTPIPSVQSSSVGGAHSVPARYVLGTTNFIWNWLMNLWWETCS